VLHSTEVVLRPPPHGKKWDVAEKNLWGAIRPDMAAELETGIQMGLHFFIKRGKKKENWGGKYGNAGPSGDTTNKTGHKHVKGTEVLKG